MSRKSESARQGAPEDHLSRRFEVSTGAGLTPLQDWLISFYLLLEDAREELNAEQWRALIWIVCDRVGEEAARLAAIEALEATEEAA
jgi:hypothetical protein